MQNLQLIKPQVRSGLIMCRRSSSLARACYVKPFSFSAYVEIYADRRRAVRPIEMADLFIATTAGTYGAAVVTRDISGFEGCVLTLTNSWEL